MNGQQIPLETISATGQAPEQRLTSAKTAHEIYQKLVEADVQAARSRAAIQAMIDGNPPYDQRELNRLGQGHRANTNFREAKAILDVALSGFLDLTSSVDVLAEVYTSFGDPGEREEIGRVIAEEFHFLLHNDWPEWDYTKQALHHWFVSQGVGITYFEDEWDWRFKVSKLGDFFIPRNTPATENSIEIAMCRRSYLAHELWGFVSDPAKARECGWNVEEVYRAIADASAIDWKSGRVIEQLQQFFKEGDLYHGYARASEIGIVHSWVREFDGTVSTYMFCEDGKSKDFLRVLKSQYESMADAFTVFTYGVGTHGTYHSIRGLGEMMFNQIQISNRLRCSAIDATMLSTALTVQPAGAEDIRKLQMAYLGPLAVLPPGLKVVERVLPNVASNVMPMIADLSRQLQNNTGQFQPRAVTPDDQERTATEVKAQLQVSSTLSESTVNLYYSKWKPLLRNVFHRLTRADYPRSRPGGEEAWAFRRRLEKRLGKDYAQALEKVYLVEPVKAVGRGSPGARLLALEELMQAMPMLSERGRTNALRDRIAARQGYQAVSRYVDKPMTSAPVPIDSKIAELENANMLAGQQVQVRDGENHAIHAEIHTGAIAEMLQSDQPPGPEQFAPLMILLQHTSEHVGKLAQDPTRTQLVGRLKQILQQAGEITQQLGEQMQAVMQAEAEAGAQAQQDGGQPQQVDPKLRAKMDEHELKMRMLTEAHTLKANLKAEDVKQRMALRDAQAAQRMRQQSQRTQPAQQTTTPPTEK